MIVTIRTPDTNHQGIGIFEALKFGLETERYADNTFDLVVHDMSKANMIANSCRGKILSIVDQLQYPVYE